MSNNRVQNLIDRKGNTVQFKDKELRDKIDELKNIASSAVTKAEAAQTTANAAASTVSSAEATISGYATSAAGSATAAAGSATAASGYVSEASQYAANAATSATAAANSATSAGSSADLAAQSATTAANNAGTASSGASSAGASATAAAGSATSAAGYASAASDSATAASGSATSAAASAVSARSYAIGGTSSRTGEDSDNAEYYKGLAATAATAAAGSVLDAEAWALGTRNGTAVESTDDEYHNNAKYYAEAAADVLDSIQEDYSTLSSNVTELKSELDGSVLTNYLAQKNGYMRALNYEYEWESGSITYPNGNDKNPDANVIRVKLPRFQWTGNISFILLNTKYRIRYYEFPDTTSNCTLQLGWQTSLGKHTFTIDPTKYYRMQIATQSGTTMNMTEALSSILIVYEDDEMNLPFAKFWDSYIEGKVQTINSYMTDGKDKTAFLLLTDTHWVNNNPAYLNSYGINTGLMKYVADRCNIQYVIHCGDLNSEHRSDINIARENMTIPVSMMRDAFEHVLLTRGNHDDNNESGNKNWSYTISQSDSYSYMFRNTKDVVFGATGTYFYHDIDFDKVRIISLDGIDFPYTNNVDPTLLDEKGLAYGYDQLQWLCDTLASTPDGYSIIIYTHEMLAPSAVTIDHPNDSPQTRANNYLVLVNILKAYKNRSNYSESISGSFSTYHSAYYTGTLTEDFRNCDATIVGVFSGHEHIDCIEEILDGNGNGIGIYNTCTQCSSNLFSSSTLSHTYQHPMAKDTITELVWDVVVVDRAQKHVDMIRIGAYAANTDIEAVTVRSFDYT